MSSSFCVDDDASSYVKRDGMSDSGDERRHSRVGFADREGRLGTFNEVDEEEESAASDDISWLDKSVAASVGQRTVDSGRGVRRTQSHRSQRSERRPSRFPARPQAPSGDVPGKHRRRGRR